MYVLLGRARCNPKVWSSSLTILPSGRKLLIRRTWQQVVLRGGTSSSKCFSPYHLRLRKMNLATEKVLRGVNPSSKCFGPYLLTQRKNPL